MHERTAQRLEEPGDPALALGNALAPRRGHLLDQRVLDHTETRAVGPQPHADLGVLDRQPGVETPALQQVPIAEEQPLAQDVERVLAVRRHVLVHRRIPRDVIHRVEGCRPGREQVAGDVGVLDDVVLLGRLGRAIPVAARDHRVGVDVGQQAVLVAGRRVVEGPHELSGLLRRQCTVTRTLAHVPPVRLGVHVPGRPHRAPAGVGGGWHRHHLEPRELLLQRAQRGQALLVVVVGDRDDPQPVGRVVRLGHPGERGSHRLFELT